MTKSEFITSVEAKQNFIKWAQVPTTVETVGAIEKCYGVAYITTPDGTNLFNVWFLNDTATNTATWQNQDTLSPEKNSDTVKLAALETYLKANFQAYFITKFDLVNNWAEAMVFQTSGADLARGSVLVFKVGNNPIAHKKIV